MKGRHIKPAVISDNSIQYNPLEDFNMSDPKFIDDMVRNISELDKAGHEQIYIALRKTKPKKFFAANNVDTRFNIYGLTDQDKQSLRRTIQLCKEDMKRKKILQEATGYHEQELHRLDEKLHINDLEDDTYVNPVNPSEAEKIREMLQMNR